MSNVPKKSSTSVTRANAQNAAPLDRPFDAAILNRAKEIAARYSIIIQHDEDLGFVGRSLELPNVFADGSTPGKCYASSIEATVAVVAFMLESGRLPPSPGGNRDSQMNVRLTAEEKLWLEETARQKGFRGVSDFVRTRALTS